MKYLKQLGRSFAPSFLCVLSLGCQLQAEPAGEQAVPIESASEALWSYPDQGVIALRQTTSSVLHAGDFGHAYSFEASEGQTVTFALEWEVPRSSLLGAAIQLRNAAGTSKLAEHVTLTSNQAHLTYTFARAGSYRIYVKHAGYALFGSYPYRFGANPDLCAAWEGYYDGFEQGDVNFFLAANFPERIGEDPWTIPFAGGLSGDDAFHATRRVVSFGDCTDLVSNACGTHGPAVFEVWFPTGSLEVVANECEMRNDVYETAGDADGWNLWWETCDAYPQACAQEPSID